MQPAAVDTIDNYRVRPRPAELQSATEQSPPEQSVAQPDASPDSVVASYEADATIDGLLRAL